MPSKLLNLLTDYMFDETHRRQIWQSFAGVLLADKSLLPFYDVFGRIPRLVCVPVTVSNKLLLVHMKPCLLLTAS
jgi:hypothetical protein